MKNQTISVGNEIVEPEAGNNYFDLESFSDSSNSRISSVLNTLTLDCFLCSLSLDHNGQSNFNAKAKKSTSLRCLGNNDLASFMNLTYSGSFTNSTKIESDFISSLNS